MKILQVITGLGIGGAETLLYNNLKELLEIDDFKTRVVYLKGDGIMEVKFTKTNIDTNNLQMKTNFDIFKKEYENKLLSIIKEFKPDIIHTHLIQADIFVKRVLLKYKLKINVIYTIHNMRPNRKLELAYYKRINKAYIKNSHYIGISKNVIQSWIPIIGKSKENIKILYNYTDFNYQSNHNKDYNTKKILYVGRIEKIKGVDILLKAFKNIENLQYNIKLDIVGDGSELNNLMRMSDDLDLKNIEFHGFSSPQEFYHESTIFILPSRSEGFGISILEAWAYRNIVIASETGGIREIIRNNENGFLFTPGDEKELENIIRKVINLSFEKSIEIEKESRNDLKKFNKESHITSLFNYYKKIVEESL